MSPSSTIRPFTKVLVANRGEIARRILRSVRELGLASVAVYSDADAASPHVAEADEAVRIGSAPSADSYLNVEHLLLAARAVGADALHPGYGFLSENADFARRCLEAGLAFIGPSPEAIARMGDKLESKRIAAQAGVPVIEGFAVEGLPNAVLAKRAEDLGYPLLIKASMGGGGRGMRIVRAAGELQAAVDGARREALAAFGDGTLLVERYLSAPRHVEIQIFGDLHGHLIHCFERECSIQRRHQKVIEEAPSMALDANLRGRMGAAAVTLGLAIGYAGAGTVEFVLDASGAFYFLEINTRLQVEHPVTEAITGLDLVRMQLEVAQGQALRETQADLAISGHAIEARLYAEDPLHDFLPATGRVLLWRVPRLPGLRIDSGVEAGSEVSVHYDAMLAKVIAHGSTREEARRRLLRGLRQLGVGGIVTNREFLLQVLTHPEFVAGRTDTHFIENHLPPELRTPTLDRAAQRAHVIAATLYRHEQRRIAYGPLPKGLPSGWRNNRWRAQVEKFVTSGQSIAVHYVARPDNWFDLEVIEAGEASITVRARLIEARATSIVLEFDGVRRSFELAGEGDKLSVAGAETCSELVRVPRFPPSLAAHVAGSCVAPMTALVRKLCVALGDQVLQGQLLLVLEAMKMEHRLVAHAPGTVTALHVHEGQMVDPDQVLVVVEPESLSQK